MARVAVHSTSEPTKVITSPFMDRLTHSVIKETSKSLKHYIDVKRRENGFILNPNSSALDAVPTRVRYLYGTSKEYPRPCGSRHSDNDVKNVLRSIQQYQKQPYSTSHTLEKQICRDELSFHMRSQRLSSRESHEFDRLRLRSSRLSHSSCSGTHSRALRHDLSRSTNYHRDQMVEDTANILATMVKARRTIFNTNLLSEQVRGTYVSRNANPSPRQPDDPVNLPSTVPPPTDPPTFSRRPSNPSKGPKTKRTTGNVLAKAKYIMEKAKPIKEAFLCEYKVSVTTGNCNGASTNAPIQLKLYGTRGYTPFIALVQSETHRVPFLKDQTDVFFVQTYHVGYLVGITIGHDQRDKRAGWYLSNVAIDDPVRERTYKIPCNAWLSSQASDQKTMRDFQVTSVVSQKPGGTSNDFREDWGSQSGYSSSTTDGPVSGNSSVSNPSTNPHGPREQHQKGPPPSPTRDPRKRMVVVSVSPPPPGRRPDAPARPTDPRRSPILSRSSSSSDMTIEEKIPQRKLSPIPFPMESARPSSPVRRRDPPTRSTEPRRSPILSRSSSSSSDTTIGEKIPQRKLSPIPFPMASAKPSTPSTTGERTPPRKPSTDWDRAPARLEKRVSSPDPPMTRPPAKKTDESDADSFFG